MSRSSLRFLFSYLRLIEREFPQKTKIIRRLKDEIRGIYRGRELYRDKYIAYERVMYEGETISTRYSYPYDYFYNLNQFHDYIYGTYRIESSNSPYDCTGQLFTSYINCFKLKDKWVAYVVNTLDV